MQVDRAEPATSSTPMDDAREPGRSRLVALAVFLVLAAVFIVTAPVNRTESDDAYQFAYEIEHGLTSHGTARHVAFVPVMRFVYLSTHALGSSISGLALTSAVNACLAAAAVALVFLLLRRRLERSIGVSILGASLLAVTYGFWRFSAEVEVYALALLTAVVAVFVATGGRLSERRRVIVVALVAALAVSAYSANALIAFVAIPAVFVAERQMRKVPLYAAVLIPALLITVALPYLGLRESGESLGEAYAAADTSGLGVDSFVKGGVGAGQAVISSGFLFAYPQFADAVADGIPGRSISDEIYTAETIGVAQRTVMTGTFALALILLLACVVMAVPGIARSWRTPLVMAMLVWLGGVVAFQLLRPEFADGPELWLLTLPPLATLVTAGLTGPASRIRHGSALLVGLVAVMLIHNGAGMAMVQGSSGDRNHAMAEWLLDNTGDGDTILTMDSSLFFRYLRYQGDAEVIFVVDDIDEWADPVGATIELALSSEGAVYATGDVFSPPDYLSQQDESRQRALVDYGTALAPSFELVHQGEFTGVYRFLTGGR
jgi:hypothetical protein